MKKLPANLIKITHFLSDCHYHSGDELGKTLAITRSAVWKSIKKLQEYGIEINTVKGKGYALSEPLLLLDKQQIKKQLKPSNKKPDIKIFACVDSTNDYLQKQPKSAKKMSICLAETQTHGRGRLNRSWHSPFGKNIYFSCRYSFEKDISEMAGLSLVVGLAVLKTIRGFGLDQHFALQWPNHIVWNQKKLAGSLIEVNAEANGNCDAIIGIGINVNLLSADKNFSWSSMTQALNKYINRNEVCANLINQLVCHLDQFEKQGFAAFKQEWVANDRLINQHIAISFHHQEKVHGIAIGVNDYGNLLLQTPTNGIQAYATGEIELL